MVCEEDIHPGIKQLVVDFHDSHPPSHRLTHTHSIAARFRCDVGAAQRSSTAVPQVRVLLLFGGAIAGRCHRNELSGTHDERVWFRTHYLSVHKLWRDAVETQQRAENAQRRTRNTKQRVAASEIERQETASTRQMGRRATTGDRDDSGREAADRGASTPRARGGARDGGDNVASRCSGDVSGRGKRKKPPRPSPEELELKDKIGGVRVERSNARKQMKSYKQELKEAGKLLQKENRRALNSKARLADALQQSRAHSEQQLAPLREKVEQKEAEWMHTLRQSGEGMYRKQQLRRVTENNKRLRAQEAEMALALDMEICTQVFLSDERVALAAKLTEAGQTLAELQHRLSSIGALGAQQRAATTAAGGQVHVPPALRTVAGGHSLARSGMEGRADVLEREWTHRAQTPLGGQYGVSSLLHSTASLTSTTALGISTCYQHHPQHCSWPATTTFGRGYVDEYEDVAQLDMSFDED